MLLCYKQLIQVLKMFQNNDATQLGVVMVMLFFSSIKHERLS